MIESPLHQIAPVNVWRLFAKICAIPHPSGREEQLRMALADIARNAGLEITTDATGNLRIDRPAAPGMENRPHILLQAHMDMVPQSNAARQFDFATMPIQPRVIDGFVYATDTTLGADNGLGLAAGLALLLDADLKCGALSLLATVEEETGLTGAKNATPEMLRGDYLLNLDSEEDGIFYIGCAGGARLNLELPLDWQSTQEGMQGFCVSVTGMKGGHSGLDIGSGRGNAIRVLLEFIERHPFCRIADIEGGSADNAIPRECTATIAVPAELATSLERLTDEYTRELRGELDVTEDFAVTVTPCPAPNRVWSAGQQDKLLGAMLETPFGVESYNERLHVVSTSNNFASAHIRNNQLHLCLMQRSMYDHEREALTAGIFKLYSPLGGKVLQSNIYPGWTPQPDSTLARKAQEVYHALFGTKPPLKVIHAGLECGIFAGKNPNLQLLSFGPTILNPHSPTERADIASTERFWKFLRALVTEL